MGGDMVLGWVAIGMAASLAGMIWPFRRGAIGVVANFLVGESGALVAGLICYVLLSRGGQEHAYASLLYSAIGAFAALGIAHVAHAEWARRVRQHPQP
jgi:uncharacterized membrane protein YeaQ/YmgE (transglycosylase-associated protein family)